MASVGSNPTLQIDRRGLMTTTATDAPVTFNVLPKSTSSLRRNKSSSSSTRLESSATSRRLSSSSVSRNARTGQQRSETDTFPTYVVDSLFTPADAAVSGEMFTTGTARDEDTQRPGSSKKSFLKSPLNLFLGNNDESRLGPEEGSLASNRRAASPTRSNNVVGDSVDAITTRRAVRPSSVPAPYDWSLDSPVSSAVDETPARRPEADNDQRTPPARRTMLAPTDALTRNPSSGSHTRSTSHPRSSSRSASKNASPTPKNLNDKERAELIKKNKKLTQMFGMTPGGPDTGPVLSPEEPNSKLSIKINGEAIGKQLKKRSDNSTWDLPDGTIYISANGRRHSEPLTPDTASFLPSNDAASLAPSSVNTQNDRESIVAPSSFIDLSDDDGASIISSPPKKPAFPHSLSSVSVSTVASEQQAEMDRKKKRDKLAKLHRFLGSRVPTELVLGDSYSTPVFVDQSPPLPKATRQSSRDLLRIHEELGDKEKAQNVRRAQKMEKVFGAQPPQALYHTRQLPSSPNLDQSSVAVPQSPKSPTHNLLSMPLASRFPSTSASPAPKKKKNRTTRRPSTADSTTGLLHYGRIGSPPSDAFRSPNSFRSNNPSPDESRFSYSRGVITVDHNRASAASSVYSHYQHSLNSLHDIILKDDVASLVQLKNYLMEGEVEGELPDQDGHLKRVDSRVSVVSSTSDKTERRHSLPLSVISDFSTTTVAPEATPDFEIRRRKAAKLTSFFGVDYRLLIHDILESIERGVDEDRLRGQLQPGEAEILLQRLRALKPQRP